MDKFQTQNANGLNVNLKLLNSHLMQFGRVNQLPLMMNSIGSSAKLENQLLTLAGEIKSREKESPPIKTLYGNNIFQNVVKVPQFTVEKQPRRDDAEGLRMHLPSSHNTI